MIFLKTFIAINDSSLFTEHVIDERSGHYVYLVGACYDIFMRLLAEKKFAVSSGTLT